MKTQAVDRTMLYADAAGDRLEHARLRVSDDGAIADGTIVGLLAGRPLRVRYEVACDSRWFARNVSIEQIAVGRDLLSMTADGTGIWRRVDGGHLEAPLFRCYDVDIPLSPVTKALTIRRLALEPKEAAIVNVAHVDAPSLTIRAIEQRFTCLEIESETSLYRFENFDSGYRAQIRVDAEGIVRDYDGAFRRLWPSA